MKIVSIKGKTLLSFLIGILGIALMIVLASSAAKHTETAKQENAQIPDGIPVPVVMYHSVLENPSQPGDYVLPAQSLKEDIHHLTEQGYTTVTMHDLIQYVYHGGSLPQKPVMLTFDDGFYNNYTDVLPILKETGTKAVISIVGSYTDQYTASNETNPQYSYLRWSDISEMMKSGAIEFQNHSYDFHEISSKRTGSMKNKGESTDAYQQLLRDNLDKVQKEFQEHTGYLPNTYAYPYGKISKESFSVIKDMGFLGSLTCNEGVSFITKDPESLYLIKRYNRPAGISTQEFFKKVEKNIPQNRQ